MLLIATVFTGLALLFSKLDRLIEALKPLPAPPNPVAGVSSKDDQVEGVV